MVGVSMREAGESFRQARPCLGLRVLTFGRPSRRSGLQKLEHKRCSQRRKGVVQSSQRISGSLRGTDGGQVLGFPTMIGATGTHCSGIPRTDFPLGVLR